MNKQCDLLSVCGLPGKKIAQPEAMRAQNETSQAREIPIPGRCIRVQNHLETGGFRKFLCGESASGTSGTGP